MNTQRRAALGAALLATSLSCAGAIATGAQAAPITEFTAGLGISPSGLTTGPDGNLWFVDSDAIGRVTPSGTITEFVAGLEVGSSPHAIVAGADGNLWFTDSGATHTIGKITPTGTITEPVPGVPAGASPYELTAGVNGMLWFTDPGNQAIGRIDTTTGAIAETSITGLDPVPSLDEITVGSDGSAYVTDKGNDPGIIKVTPAGVATESLTDALVPPSPMPSGIGPGNDGNVWFTDQGVIGRSTPGGVSTTFDAGLQPGSEPDAIVPGPDGNEWFDDQLSGSDKIGRITPSGQITEFVLSSTPWDLTAGIDGNLWVPIGDMGTPGSTAVVRVTSTGTETPITSGLLPTAAFTDGNTNIVSGPDGNLWTIDGGTPKAIVRVDVELPPTVATGASSSVSSTSATIAGTVNARGSASTVTIQYGTTTALGSTAAAATVTAGTISTAVSGTLSGLTGATQYFYRVAAINSYGTVTGATQSFTTSPAAATGGAGGKGGGAGGGGTGPTAATTRTLSGRVGNQSITVTLPGASASVCVASPGPLRLKVNSVARAGETGPKLHFRSAAVFLDRGVKQVRTTKVSGKRARIVTYKPNAVAHRVPAALRVSLRRVNSGPHRVKVTLTYTKRIRAHDHTRITTVTRTLKTTVTVC